ncbi:MAG: hypothetical protein WA057_03265 [Candidatus Magasanikiibacteriota bacterium]
MIKNYTQRLDKLKKRRTDDILQKAYLSESFGKSEFKESVKYTLESMKAIEASYTKNTFLASEKVQTNLSKGFTEKNIKVTYRHQGSVETNTSIKLHSDIDLLVITGKYFSLEPPQIPANPYTGDPLDDLKELRTVSFSLLTGIYKKVNDSKPKAIQVFPTEPDRKVDVVVANWYHSLEYYANGSTDRFIGIHIYDKNQHSRKADFPFLHISKLNEKDILAKGGLKKLIRLLKTLKVDADSEINLSSFEITSMMFEMSLVSLIKSESQSLLLLPEASKQLDKIITDKVYRENLYSPNGKELVFGINTEKIVEIKKLKLELDELIQDITEDLSKSFRKIDAQFIYS